MITFLPPRLANGRATPFCEPPQTPNQLLLWLGQVPVSGERSSQKRYPFIHIEESVNANEFSKAFYERVVSFFKGWKKGVAWPIESETGEGIKDSIEENKDGFDDELKKTAEIFLSYGDEKKLGNLHLIQAFENQLPELKKDHTKLINLVDKTGGVPSTYALLKTIYDTYDEFGSSWAEEPLEERWRKQNRGTSAQREVYHKLAQLAFDSGKISVKDYKYLMGKKFCEREDCSDKLCVEYTLTCCINHPESPNC